MLNTGVVDMLLSDLGRKHAFSIGMGTFISLSNIERPGMLKQSDIGGHFLRAYPGCQSLAQL